MRPALTSLVAAALLAGCGGATAAERAAEAYVDYLAAEEERSSAEAAFNRAFGAIAQAARTRDRSALVAGLAAARAAGARIHGSLDAELEAAAGLVAYGPTRVEGRRLEGALRRSRDGLRLFERQLEIAETDPFLDRVASADEVRRLSREAVALSVAGALDRRAAVRALAAALELEPPFDARYDAPRRG